MRPWDEEIALGVSCEIESKGYKSMVLNKKFLTFKGFNPGLKMLVVNETHLRLLHHCGYISKEPCSFQTAVFLNISGKYKWISRELFLTAGASSKREYYSPWHFNHRKQKIWWCVKILPSLS